MSSTFYQDMKKQKITAVFFVIFLRIISQHCLFLFAFTIEHKKTGVNSMFIRVKFPKEFYKGTKGKNFVNDGHEKTRLSFSVFSFLME